MMILCVVRFRVLGADLAPRIEIEPTATRVGDTRPDVKPGEDIILLENVRPFAISPTSAFLEVTEMRFRKNVLYHYNSVDDNDIQAIWQKIETQLQSSGRAKKQDPFSWTRKRDNRRDIVNENARCRSGTTRYSEIV